MAARKPLVRAEGGLAQLPDGDYLDSYLVTGSDTTTDLNTLTTPGPGRKRFGDQCPNAPSSGSSNSWMIDVYGDEVAIVQVATPLHILGAPSFTYYRTGAKAATWFFSGWKKKLQTPTFQSETTPAADKNILLSSYDAHNLVLSRDLSSLTIYPTLAPNGVYQLNVIQDAVGGWSVAALNGVLNWSGAPAISQSPGAITTFTFYVVEGLGCYLIGSTLSEPRGGGKFIARVPSTRRIVAGAGTNAALTTLASTAARIQFIPFVPARRIRLTQIGIIVGTLLAGTATVGVYAADGAVGNDVPGTKIASCANGAINTGTVGTKMAALAAAVTLEAGVLYFISVICTAAVVLRTIPLAGQENVLGFTDNSANAVSGFWAAGATNVLPDVAPAVTANVNVAIPALYLLEG